MAGTIANAIVQAGIWLIPLTIAAASLALGVVALLYNEFVVAATLGQPAELQGRSYLWRMQAYETNI